MAGTRALRGCTNCTPPGTPRSARDYYMGPLHNRGWLQCWDASFGGFRHKSKRTSCRSQRDLAIGVFRTTTFQLQCKQQRPNNLFCPLKLNPPARIGKIAGTPNLFLPWAGAGAGANVDGRKHKSSSRGYPCQSKISSSPPSDSPWEVPIAHPRRRPR